MQQQPTATAQQQAWADGHELAIPGSTSAAAGADKMAPQLAAVQDRISKRIKHLDDSNASR